MVEMYYLEMPLGDIHKFSPNAMDSAKRIGTKNPLQGFAINADKFTAKDKIIQDFIGSKGVVVRIAKEIIHRRASAAPYLKRSGSIGRGFGLVTFYNNECCYYWQMPTAPIRNDNAKTEAKFKWSHTRFWAMSDTLFYRDEAHTMFAENEIINTVRPMYSGMTIMIFNRAEHAAALMNGVKNPLTHGYNKEYKIFTGTILNECARRIIPYGDGSFSTPQMQSEYIR